MGPTLRVRLQRIGGRPRRLLGEATSVRTQTRLGRSYTGEHCSIHVSRDRNDDDLHTESLHGIVPRDDCWAGLLISVPFAESSATPANVATAGLPATPRFQVSTSRLRSRPSLWPVTFARSRARPAPWTSADVRIYCGNCPDSVRWAAAVIKTAEMLVIRPGSGRHGGCDVRRARSLTMPHANRIDYEQGTPQQGALAQVCGATGIKYRAHHRLTLSAEPAYSRWAAGIVMATGSSVAQTVGGLGLGPGMNFSVVTEWL